MIGHKDLTGIDIHVPYKQIFDDEADRNAFLDLDVKDIKCMALQEDDDKMFILTNHSPITQKEL